MYTIEHQVVSTNRWVGITHVTHLRTAIDNAYCWTCDADFSIIYRVSRNGRIYYTPSVEDRNVRIHDRMVRRLMGDNELDWKVLGF